MRPSMVRRGRRKVRAAGRGWASPACGFWVTSRNRPQGVVGAGRITESSSPRKPPWEPRPRRNDPTMRVYVSRPTGGYLVGRLGVRTLLTVSLSLNAIACLSMAAAPRSFGIVIGAIVVLGVGCGLPYAAMFTRAAALFPGRAGAAMGLVNMLGIVMILVGAPLVGRLVDVTKSYTSSFVALGVFSLLILVTSQFIHRDARV